MANAILSFGAYVPRLRLKRQVVAEANSWFNPGLKGLAKGERAMCNWDEDAVTMAVEAARDCLAGRDRAAIASIQLASTTAPFRDRLNAGIVTEALGLSGSIAALDVTASQRAATSALLAALAGGATTLVIGSEKRRTKAAAPLELTSGDGAAAILVGPGEPVARLLGAASRTADFVDHYRSDEQPFDYQWEERWIRDEGYMRLVPPAIAEALAKGGVAAAGVTHFIMPSTLPRVAQSVAKAAGIADTAIRDTLAAQCGETGAAHPLLMLAHVLETAKAGERILVAAFGQGADALLIEATGKGVETVAGRRAVSGHLARRREETSYGRFLAFNNLVEIERGMRADIDKHTALSAVWRKRELLTSFVGGRCSKCGTLQIPRSNICVNPNCNAMHTQEPVPFADRAGRVNSYTADRLTYSPDPPACYGMIQFEEGGRLMMDFTDVDADKLEVGQTMRMMFRIKDYDAARGFTRYFWKAAPT